MSPQPPAPHRLRRSLPLRQRLNVEYLRHFKQIPLMLRLRADRRHGPLPANVRRLLIVDNALVGEFVASLPAIRQLLDDTGARADIIVSPPCGPLARRLRDVDAVFLAPSICQRETERGVHEAGSPSGAYDLVLVVEISASSLDMVRRARYEHIKVSLGDFLRYVPYVSTRLTQKTGLKQVEDVMFEVVERTRTRQAEFDRVFQFDRHDLERLARLPFLRDATRVRVVIHTGSGWEAKLWEQGRWTQLLRRIDRLGRFQFLFVGGSQREERDLGEIRRQLPFAVHSVVRQADLAEVALIMRQSDYFIGVDSGPRHLAHLLQLPSVCLLGPGPRMYSPEGRGAVYLDRADCRCTTLFCHRRDRCMDRISVEDAVDAFTRLLKPTARPMAVVGEGRGVVPP